jgi:hypothetical protein
MIVQMVMNTKRNKRQSQPNPYVTAPSYQPSLKKRTKTAIMTGDGNTPIATTKMITAESVAVHTDIVAITTAPETIQAVTKDSQTI